MTFKVLNAVCYMHQQLLGMLQLQQRKWWYKNRKLN